jgi:hypothetical protein
MALAVIVMKFFRALGALIAAAAGLIVIYQFVIRPHTPAYSGNVTAYSAAGNLISFLGQHTGHSVDLTVTCNDRDGCALSQGSGGSPEIALYASPAAARCWPGGGPCTGGALLTFITRAGGSGSRSPNGAGNLSLTGTWSLQDMGSGGTSPEGDPTYQLSG